MSAGVIKWLGAAAMLSLVGIGGALGHFVLAAELGGLSYLALALLATSVGLGIGHAALGLSRRHQEQVERHNEELSVLNAVAVTASRSLEVSSVLADCLMKTLEVLKLDAGAIFLASDSDAPSLAANRGLDPEFLDGLARLRVGADAGPAEPEHLTLLESQPGRRGDHVRASLRVPIRSEGTVLGAMFLVSRGFRTFSPREVQILVSIGDVIGMAVRNAQLHAQVQEHARRDPLTGLYNRRYFDRVYAQELERARRYSAPLTVAMIDLDRFKQINDRSGHSAGDRVLEAVADILRDGRSTDVAARYGGDEFVLLMPNTDVRGAAVVAERIRRAARAAVVPGVLVEGIGLSIGLADSTEGYGRLIERADARMYAQKRSAGLELWHNDQAVGW